MLDVLLPASFIAEDENGSLGWVNPELSGMKRGEITYINMTYDIKLNVDL